VGVARGNLDAPVALAPPPLRVFSALPVGGFLVVYEAIIDDDRSKNAFGLMILGHQPIRPVRSVPRRSAATPARAERFGRSPAGRR
jgi:hypothetical protein